VTNQIAVLRARQKWSQAELAGQLKVSRQTINAIETGRYDPSLPLAFKIAVLFGMHIEEVFSPNIATNDVPAQKEDASYAYKQPDREI
jgi:putative transcriptional regulator